MTGIFSKVSRSIAANLISLFSVLVLGLIHVPAVHAQLFADDFNRSDSSTVGNGWSEEEEGAIHKVSLASNALQMSQPAGVDGADGQNARVYRSGSVHDSLLVSGTIRISHTDSGGVGTVARVVVRSDGSGGSGLSTNPNTQCTSPFPCGATVPANGCWQGAGFGFAMLADGLFSGPGGRIQIVDGLELATVPFPFTNNVLYAWEMAISAQSHVEVRVWDSAAGRPATPTLRFDNGGTAYAPTASGSNWQIEVQNNNDYGSGCGSSHGHTVVWDDVSFTQSAVCGDGSIEGNEECDDGNAADGEGCSGSCAVEAGWVCSGEPSSCFEPCPGDCTSELSAEDGQKVVEKYLKKLLADLSKCAKKGDTTCPCPTVKADKIREKLGDDLGDMCVERLVCETGRLMSEILGADWDSDQDCYSGLGASKCNKTALSKVGKLGVKRLVRDRTGKPEKNVKDLGKCIRSLSRSKACRDTPGASDTCLAAVEFHSAVVSPTACETLSVDAEGIEAAVESVLLSIEAEGQSLEDVWGDPASFAEALVRVDRTVGCHSSDVFGIAPPGAAEAPALAPRAAYDSSVGYCGPGTTLDGVAVAAKKAGSCINPVCHMHDECYGQQCIPFICSWTPLTSYCDSGFFGDALGTCLGDFSKCGYTCHSIIAIAQGLVGFQYTVADSVCVTFEGVFGDVCLSGCQDSCCCEESCPPGSTQSCSTGLLGICGAGTQTCNAQGSGYGSCVQNQTAGTETIAAGTCNNSLDDDCDGATDGADSGCQTCSPGSTQACSTGLSGICAAGTQTCNAQGSGYGSCVQNQTAGTETIAAGTCNNSLDDDCDGATDTADSGCRCYETEPNNSSASPDALTTDSPCFGAMRGYIFPAGDADWFDEGGAAFVTVPAGTTIRYTLVVPAGVDYDLELYGPDSGNPNQHFLVGSTNRGVGLNEDTGAYLTQVTGFYAIRVVGFSSSSSSSAEYILGYSRSP